MNSKYWLPAALSLALLLGACGSTKERTGAEGTDTTQTSEPYTDRIAPGPAPLGDGYDAAAAERALTTNIVYFDFDESTIKPEYQSVIDAFAAYLSANQTARVRLEGHADERGTREYNIGLGERRGNAVQSALLAKGVSSQQISVVSYGEERPADTGHDDAAWAKNRRVQIVRQ